MQADSLISIILPVYNASIFVEKALESLENQTLKSIELIVVDDCSVDEISDVINKFRERASFKVSFIRNQKNLGVHESRLIGIKAAKGQWIGFVDADDTVEPEMYKRLYLEAERYSADIVVCGSELVSVDGRKIGKKVSFPKDRLYQDNIFNRFCMLEFSSGVLWNKLYRREVIVDFSNMHFPWRQDRNEDYLLNIGCFSRASSVLVLRDMLYKYTKNPDSATSSVKDDRKYVDFYRSFSIAMSLFPELSESQKLSVIGLYREQLRAPFLFVNDLNTLAEYENELREAVDLVYKNYPLGISLLTARIEPKFTHSLKLVVKKIFKRIRFGNH